MSVRIVGGAFAGRLLFGPASGRGRGSRGDGAGLRPSAARLRKSLFGVLLPELHGAEVLDVCAGVGTLGFEALSRGAAHCVFLERDRRMCRLIERNAARLGLNSLTLLEGEAAPRLARLAAARREFGILFCDPPWYEWTAGGGMRTFAAALRLRPRTAVCEHPAKFSPPSRIPLRPGAGGDARQPAAPGEFLRSRTRIVGQGAYSLYRRAPEPMQPSAWVC